MGNEPVDFDAVEPVTVWDRRLVGCEPITRALLRCDPDEYRTLRESWEAAVAAGRECYLVSGDDGRQTVWQEQHDFWRV